MKRLLALILSVCMLLSLALPVSAEEENVTSEDLVIEELDPSQANTQLLEKLEADQELALKEEIHQDQVVKVIVIMESESIVEQDNFAEVSDETAAMAEALEAEQQSVIDQIENAGVELEVNYQFTWLLNGFAADVTYGSINAIKALDGVKKVLLQPVYEVCKSDINTISDGSMIGRESTWAAGYTGKGVKIAIIDTGLDYDHQNFQALPEEALTASSATPETVASVLDQLNASVRYGGLTIEDVYYSTKVAYGFNYCDDDLDISHDYDGQSDHGTHVAGIAAANKVEESEVVGVAPDAQLYIMKVFGKNGGAYTEDILAALEDAMMLGADVVNMSLGSPAGFTSDAEEVNAIYASVANTGMVMANSAGNNYNAGLLNLYGNHMSITANPDNGVTGSPATYANTMAVASVENLKTLAVYIDAAGYPIGYNTSSNGQGADITTLSGSYGFVAVPDGGIPEAYEGLDVAGKVALVQRGNISFGEKVDYAAAAGAVACIVYNNTTGSISMDLTGSVAAIPAVSITMADGEYLIAAQEADPEMVISFPSDPGMIPNALAYQISDFSSWGVAPDLTLKPEIAAPGGNIYSTVNNGGYDLMSGTSMAAPNVAGMAAAVMQYVKETFGDGVDARQMVRHLLMSTSVPLYYDSEYYVEYSPRQQGSGLANAYNAVTTQAYLSVPGCDLPKAELGDDPDRTGEYSFTYQVTNFSNKDAYYVTYTTALTEGVTTDGMYLYMAGVPTSLYAGTAEFATGMVLAYDVDESGATDTHDAFHILQAAKGTPVDENWTDVEFRYDVNGDANTTDSDVQAYLDALVGLDSEANLTQEVLKVPAGETETVDVYVALHDYDKMYMDAYFPNGIYVEGFSYLVALNEGGVDLSLPYLGFYGNWDDAPVLDDGFYWDELNRAEDDYNVYGNQTTNVLATNMGGNLYYLGGNVYVNEPFDKAHISVSPNGDGYADTVDEAYVSLLRNADQLLIRFIDMETGEVYYEDGLLNVRKSIVNMNYGEILPFFYSDLQMYTDLYGFTDAEGNVLPNNAKVLMEVAALGSGETEEETWSVPITVDTVGPQLLNASKLLDLDTGNTYLELTFSDNVAASVIGLLSGDGSQAYTINALEDPEPAEDGNRYYTVTCNITGLEGKVMLILSDYAVNETYFGLNLGGEGNPYGQFVAFQDNFNTETSGWVSFDSDVYLDEVAVMGSDISIVCAEYVNGYVFAQDETGALYGFRYEDMLADTLNIETTYIATLDNVYQDLAYSYAEGKLYGLHTYVDYDGYPTSEIFTINLNGEYYDPNLWTTVMPYEEVWALQRGGVYGLTLAINDEGTLYMAGTNYDWDSETVTGNAHLWTVGMEYDEWSDSYMLGWAMTDLGDLGVTMDYLQSMTWNHNDERLYWAHFTVDGYYPVMDLCVVDTETLEVTSVGELCGETYALMAPLNAEAAAKPEHQNVPEMDSAMLATPVLRDATVNMSIGGTYELIYDVDPWYSQEKAMVWSSNDETVVTVDQNGNLTAVGAGSAVITVANAKDASRFDTVTVEVSAISLKIEGVISAQDPGLGNASGVSTYAFIMDQGVPSFGTVNAITAPEELNYGLQLATSVMGRDSIYACEYGNTGMIYEIDPVTGEVVDVMMPVDGDMMFGMSYSEASDTFNAIMNYYLYVDLPLTHEAEEEMLASYDEEQNMFMYHRLNLLPYLHEAGAGFVTGETGQGASSEIVMCGITTIPGGEEQYMYMDFTGNWGPEITYTPDQTLVILDNVGRLWYIDEVFGLTETTDEWGNTFYMNADGTAMITPEFHGVMSMETAEEGVYNVFVIRAIEETPLTEQFRAGKMPRITYHFTDIEYAGETSEGAPIIAMSLYDYWNNGTTNELYLYVPGVGTGEFTMDENWNYVEVKTPDRLIHLGNTGDHNIIASIHAVEILGGLESEQPEGGDEFNALGVGKYVAE